LGSAGAIALSASIYPTAIRSTGIGLGMAMGRLGQVIGPLIAGALLSAGWTAGGIMLVIAIGSLVAAVFVAMLKVWMTRRRDVASTETGGTLKTVSPFDA
jgi:AAHS family 4-hydroxybenzoate transporter-like MFS transporter